MPVKAPSSNASPVLIICASDDPLGLAAGSIELYSAWAQKKLNAALHMYSISAGENTIEHSNY